MAIPSTQQELSTDLSATTWQNFKRLLTYAKPYKLGFVAAIIGMLGYAAIDVYFLSKLQPNYSHILQREDIFSYPL